MRILLCDDDEKILQQMNQYLLEFFHLAKLRPPQIAAYTSGDALAASGDVGDIAILDVEMPGLSGIHVGEKLKRINPRIKIMILTSYMDYLDEAMKFHVFRYLSKPVDKSRLFRNMKEALYQIQLESRPIPIQTKDGVIVRQADDVLLVEAQGRKVTVTAVDRIYETVTPMRDWVALLKIPSFFQTHRSYIVNMRYVASFTKDTVRLVGPNSLERIAYLTKRRYTEFKNTYLLYLESTR